MRQLLTLPFHLCYNCKGEKETYTSNRKKCDWCDCDGDEQRYCFEKVPCPTCDGTGYKDKGQGQLL